MSKKPEIIVFAGPNGSGKSTITKLAKIIEPYLTTKQDIAYGIKKAILNRYNRNRIAFVLCYQKNAFHTSEFVDSCEVKLNFNG